MVFENISHNKSFIPPANYLSIKTIEMHTGGEPLRVILEGFPEIKGNNVLEKRAFVRDNYDYLRKALMFEPRGHADMYGCLLVPPNDEEGDFGIIFLHNEGYSTMCGHAIIAIATLAIKMNWVEIISPITTLKIDAPCGRITAMAKIRNGAVDGVAFHCVPSFALALDQKVEVPDLGEITFDLGYGGAFYAYVDATKLGLDLIPSNYAAIIQKGMAIKKAVMKSDLAITHPFEKDLSFLYGTIFIGGPISKGIDSRNVCVFAEGEVDRCPTGSGVSGRLPIHLAKGEIKIGEEITVESITGSVFKGKIIKALDYGPYKALIPEVEGTAYITGQNEFLIDPNDPFKYGFFLR